MSTLPLKEPASQFRRTAASAFTALLMLVAQMSIAIVALTSVRFTTERDHATVAVADYRLCSASMGASTDQLGDGCIYNNVSVHGDLLRRTFIISTPEGYRIESRDAESVVVNGAAAVERKTILSWLVLAVAASGACFPVLARFFRGALEKSERGASLLYELSATHRWHASAAAIVILAVAVYAYPSFREFLVVHRIEVAQEQYRTKRGPDVPVFASATLRGDLSRLGGGVFDRALRQAGFGCQLYDADGRVTSAGVLEGGTIRRANLPAGTRVGGRCFYG
ncbi:hypothetical protein [Burkholderia sp. Ac-20365]|uniref:hypothetical protein n=1 Tax=Burkholderia sp. Ac-20365 TaxID=2703897 RepID=UPI00197C6E5D|nr:hypothetical protein [Burkholderia sp. Ac-20365]MBN3761251.1 hypothetical protein [Burkholderia sp. Ac-20365]